MQSVGDVESGEEAVALTAVSGLDRQAGKFS